MTGLRFACSCALVLALAACQMPNPAFDPIAGTDETTKTGGDGDGDSGETGDGVNSDDGPTGDGDPSEGDGDGDPGDGDPGDGDGDPGDGDGDPNACALPLKVCDGECIDTATHLDHCGDCGFPCDEQQLCVGGHCGNKRYVFVSSTLRGAVFDLGIGQANSLCNELAQDAMLPGNYAAWMSTSFESPSESPVEGVFVRTDERIVATSWADLTDGTLLEPINLTEIGDLAEASPACNNAITRAVWTATSASGEFLSPNCGGWLLNTVFTHGKVGNADATNLSWTASDCNSSCNWLMHIYCVQQ